MPSPKQATPTPPEEMPAHVYAIGDLHLFEGNPRQGDVLDMFGGSGSTLLAAHRTGRVARLIELDPKYADVICRRYEEHTGVVPIRERTGKAHSFVPDAETERTEA